MRKKTHVVTVSNKERCFPFGQEWEKEYYSHKFTVHRDHWIHKYREMA